MLERVIQKAQSRFGEVQAIMQHRDDEYKLIIKQDRPTFQDAPYMKITAYINSAYEISFEHGHYDLTAEKAGLVHSRDVNFSKAGPL